MEKPTFTRANLSDVRMIIAIMRVLMVDLLCQAVTGRIPTLECMLLGARGCLWVRPIMAGIKCHCFSRTHLQWHLPGTERTLGCNCRGGQVRADPGREDKAN
jgi:hypothetical protein